jgi:integrase/recombinase XerD
MTELRRRMDEDMLARGFAERTRESYLWAVTGLARFYHRSPDRISDAEVQAYLVHLLRDRQRSWSTVNIVVSGLRFFFHTTLKRARTDFSIPSPRQSGRLPVVLSRDEVERVIQAAPSLRYRTMLLVAYAAGLRLSEVTHLRVADIDSKRMTVRVVQGKGGQDRYTILTPPLLVALRTYWQVARPRDWLFPGRFDPRRPVDPTGLQKAYQRAKARRGHHEARRRPHPAPLLRDASARSRGRSPHHSTAAGARPAVDDRAVLPADPASRDRRRLPAGSTGPVHHAPGRPGVARCVPGRRARPARCPRSSSPTSSARLATRMRARTGWRPCSTARCARLRRVGPPPWAVIRRRVTTAAPRASAITRVETGTARSARRPRARRGSQPARPSCYRSRTSTSSSPCRTPSTPWPREIRA